MPNYDFVNKDSGDVETHFMSWKELDKFKEDNCIKALEYMSVLTKIAPHKIKYGDEKSMKDRDIVNKKVRRNPLTGVVPPVFTSRNLSNTYSLTGFCGA